MGLLDMVVLQNYVLNLFSFLPITWFVVVRSSQGRFLSSKPRGLLWCVPRRGVFFFQNHGVCCGAFLAEAFLLGVLRVLEKVHMLSFRGQVFEKCA